MTTVVDVAFGRPFSMTAIVGGISRSTTSRGTGNRTRAWIS